MNKSHLLFCVFLLFLSIHQIKVSALFNVTKEALLTGLQYKNEAEKKEDYKTIDDLNIKISKIQNIFYSFVEKNRLENINLTTTMLKKYFNHLRENRLYATTNFVYQSYNNDIDESLEVPTTTELYPNVIIPRYVVRFIDETGYTYSNESLKNLLNECHEVLLKNNSDTERSVVFSLNGIIGFEQSEQEVFILFSRSIIILDAFAYNLIQHAYALHQVFSDGVHLLDRKDKGIVKAINNRLKEKDIIKTMNSLEEKFKQRNEDTILVVKNLASQMSRELWNYKRSAYGFMGQYTKLQNVFQKYIVNEVDLNSDGSCKNKCSDYNQTKVHGCFNKKICARQRTCYGNLWDCNHEIKNTMNICPSIEDGSSRYKFLKVNREYYGETNRTVIIECDKNLTEAKSWSRGFVECTYCICTCDNANIEGDRYFNLRDVTSDTEFNYVITNARFKKENNVIHIQIQQGELLPEAEVNVTSVSWKSIDNYKINQKCIEDGKDYHTISWHQRTMCLDQLTSPSNHVLTGLRFRLKDDYLKLEIQATPFDFKTGKLASNLSYWISNNENLHSRTELEFYERRTNRFRLKSTQYFRFTASNMKRDVGQNTIPYIDIEEVKKLKFALPLSGFGIFYKEIEDIGELLSLNLVTYDITSHIE